MTTSRSYDDPSIPRQDTAEAASVEARRGTVEIDWVRERPPNVGLGYVKSFGPGYQGGPR